MYLINQRHQDSLASYLCQLYGLDQGLRISPGFPGKMKLIQSVDSFNYKRIMDFVETYGIPNEKLLGDKNYSAECASNVLYSILLHNPHILINDSRNLNILKLKVEQGELNPKILSNILDKYYSYYGKKRPLIGSDWGYPCKEDKLESDSIRKFLGFAPLADSLFISCKIPK